MHILITGAAGMIGRKLTARLVNDGALNGSAIEKLTLIDVIVPESRRNSPAQSKALRPTSAIPIPRPKPSPAGPT